MKNKWKQQLQAYCRPTWTPVPSSLLKLSSLRCWGAAELEARQAATYGFREVRVGILQTFVVTNHPDAAVLKRLEVQQFQDTKKKPWGKKIPAGQSYSKEEETMMEGDHNSNLEDSVEES